jgi:hypothetical protein
MGLGAEGFNELRKRSGARPDAEVEVVEDCRASFSPATGYSREVSESFQAGEPFYRGVDVDAPAGRPRLEVSDDRACGLPRPVARSRAVVLGVT